MKKADVNAGAIFSGSRLERVITMIPKDLAIKLKLADASAGQ